MQITAINGVNSLNNKYNFPNTKPNQYNNSPTFGYCLNPVQAKMIKQLPKYMRDQGDVQLSKACELPGEKGKVASDEVIDGMLDAAGRNIQYRKLDKLIAGIDDIFDKINEALADIIPNGFRFGS